MNFGKYAVLQPVKYHFKKEPELWWQIKPPTSGDELEMARFLNGGKLTLGVDGTTRDAPPTWLEVAHREIALTFDGTNIPMGDQPVEDGGEPILKPGQSTDEIEAVLRLMPHEMVMEIWQAIGEAVPGWGAKPAPNPESRSES